MGSRAKVNQKVAFSPPKKVFPSKKKRHGSQPPFKIWWFLLDDDKPLQLKKWCFVKQPINIDGKGLPTKTQPLANFLQGLRRLESRTAIQLGDGGSLTSSTLRIETKKHGENGPGPDMNHGELLEVFEHVRYQTYVDGCVLIICIMAGL